MRDAARGGKPMPNSWTVMPHSLATTKWPTSWTSTRTTMMASVATMVARTSMSGGLLGLKGAAHLGVEGDDLVEARFRIRPPPAHRVLDRGRYGGER